MAENLEIQGGKAGKPTDVSPNLELVVTRQVSRLIRLGLHREVYPNLSQTEAASQYRRDFALPTDAVQPARYKGRFDIIVVVDPRIPLSRVHARASIEEKIYTAAIADLVGFPQDHPFVTFTHNGQKYRHRPDPREEAYSLPLWVALDLFGEDEVGKPLVDVTYHYLQFPKHFGNKGMIGMAAAGSRCVRGTDANMYTGMSSSRSFDVGRTPWLAAFGGRPFGGKPEVGAYYFGGPVQGWGLGSRGKEIIELGV